MKSTKKDARRKRYERLKARGDNLDAKQQLEMMLLDREFGDRPPVMERLARRLQSIRRGLLGRLEVYRTPGGTDTSHSAAAVDQDIRELDEEIAALLELRLAAEATR